ncbi:MAG: hypothetical protein ACT4P7_14690 [Gemmatimonadaceae bacterium]
MNDDEKFDAWLREAASDYNRPRSEVPREAMWQAIQPAIAPRATAAMPFRQSRLRRWVPLAAAATLLVVASYQMGRVRGASSTAPVTATATTTVPAADSALYSRASEQHFGRADALLTSLRAAGVGDSLDASLQHWARELLVDTRLLMDSPAATDPSRRRLLEDLELALAQIVQLNAAATADDHRLVERSLQRGELLTRIRTVVPSALSGT